jgi:hypothetical protein
VRVVGGGKGTFIVAAATILRKKGGLGLAHGLPSRNLKTSLIRSRPPAADPRSPIQSYARSMTTAKQCSEDYHYTALSQLLFRTTLRRRALPPTIKIQIEA